MIPRGFESNAGHKSICWQTRKNRSMENKSNYPYKKVTQGVLNAARVCMPTAALFKKKNMQTQKYSTIKYRKKGFISEHTP